MYHDELPRRAFLGAVGTLGLAGATGVSTATSDPATERDEVLVGVTAGIDDVASHVARQVPSQARVAEANEALDFARVRFPSEASGTARENFLGSVETREGIAYAEPNGRYEPLLTPNDPRLGEQYAPQMVDAPTAWDTTLGSASVSIGVVDTGALYTHPDLDGNFASDPGYDYIDGDSDPLPPSGEIHGTHVAGIAGGETDNAEGVAGISESTLVNARSLTSNGGSWSAIANGVEYCVNRGVDVINMSLGGSTGSQTIKNALSYAQDNGVLVVAAAGNDSGPVSYPAAYPEALAVSALDADSTLASYSNRGPEIELTAPGTNVLSAYRAGGYVNLSGTSMAAPVVAGVAALTAEQWGIGGGDLRQHLLDTATDIGLSSDRQGSGRVNAANAVETDPGSGGGGGDGSFSVGDDVRTTANVNTRSGPEIADNVIDSQATNTPGVVVDGPVEADGYTWYEFEYDSGTTGWAVQQYHTDYSGFHWGDRVETTDALNVRTGPGLSYSTVWTAPQGSAGTVQDGPAFADGYTWYEVAYDAGYTGWCAGSFLRRR